jgi:hypothetical protein
MENYFFAEMYIQNSGWREQWNENLNIKVFSFAKGNRKTSQEFMTVSWGDISRLV